ncbi:hypothetical protein [Thalassolituus marinus]|uniref:DUF4234 domain-containing protein n=1 Tax=Thalassolituus marinus TaxID=671053 RepID=A0ABS7ZU32_9GAMM|nr:hypothetical protein [Thalassolituus marinus]MCA6065219.1 DUF4234 domain-containing protein [Thalassolituus marinus]
MQASNAGPRNAAFYQVGTEKFIELSLVTFGVYGIYWTWANWKAIQQAGEPVNPLLRTLFAVFWQFSLYQRIAVRAGTEDMGPRWKPVRLFVLFAAFSVLPIWMLITAHPWAALAGLLTLLPNVLVNQSINAINEKYLPFYEQNTELSASNWTAVVAGVVGWLTLLTLALTSDL